MRACSAATALSVALLGAAPAATEAQLHTASDPLLPPRLGWAEVLQLAQERAPEVLAARAEAGVARGRLVGASPLLAENPSLGVAGGGRLGPRSVLPELEVSLLQSLEVPGRRAARLDAAEAAWRAASAEAEEVERQVTRAAALTYVRAVHAIERERLMATVASAAERTVTVAARRHAAGEVPLLETNAARAAAARARAAQRSMAATRLLLEGELRSMLGLPAAPPLAVDGVLQDLVMSEVAAAEPALEARPDLRALKARLDEAGAELRVGESRWWPDLGVGARYSLEEGAHGAAGIVELSLPTFDNGEATRVEARARAEALGARLTARQGAAVSAWVTSRAVLEERRGAARELQQAAVPLADENVLLARRGYEAGELGLADLLALERDAASAHELHLDLMLEAALALIDLLFSAPSAGASP